MINEAEIIPWFSFPTETLKKAIFHALNLLLTQIKKHWVLHIAIRQKRLPGSRGLDFPSSELIGPAYDACGSLWLMVSNKHESGVGTEEMTWDWGLVGSGPLFLPEALATLESIVQPVSLQLVVQIGELLQETFVRSDVTVHANRPDRLSGRHLADDHQVRQDTGCRPGHAHHAVHQNFSSAVDSVFDELWGNVKVSADVRCRLIHHRKAHVPNSGHVPIVAVAGVHLAEASSFRRVQYVCDPNQS